MSVRMRVFGQGIGTLESWGRGGKEALTGGSLGHRMWAPPTHLHVTPTFPMGKAGNYPA